MDLLSLANDINAELIHIHLQYSDAFDQQGPAAIFNSIVSCITDDLADNIKLQIVDRHDPQHVFLSWEYDLHDRQYPRRVGPELGEILQVLKKLPGNKMHLVCTPQWSRHFQSLDSIAQERLLRYTIWEKNPNAPRSTSNHPGTQLGTSSGSAFLSRTVDINLLENELLRLATETRVIDKQEVDAICESVKMCIEADHIQGIHLELMENGKGLILEWDYVFSAEGKLMREGAKSEQVLSIAKALKGHPKLLTNPIQTTSFKKLPPKIQQEVMKDTIWASAFKKKGLLSW